MLVLTGSLSMASCQLGRHYTRPELNLPERLSKTQQSDTLTIADMQWWEIYTDTTLQQLINKTLDHNKDLLIAAARVKELAAMKRIDWANLFPRITLTANYGLESKQMSDFFKSPIHYLGANLLGPLFAMGKNRAMLKAQKAAYEQACYGYEKTVLSAFKDARNAIVEFNKIKEIYESRRELERSSKATMELAQLQYINGVIGYLDVLDAQRSYFDAQIGLSNAIRDKQITMVKMYKALGGGW